MSIRWHLEGWVKAYRTKSPGWLRLPVSARGLGRELLTYADEDTGAIPLGDGPIGLEVAYLLGARPKEHRRIVEDVAELVKDGYLIVEPGRLVIRNFVEAQDRTPGAKRTAAWRERKNAEHEAKKFRGASPAPSDETHPITAENVTTHPPCDVPGDVTITSQQASPETSHETRAVTETYARVESSRDREDLISENSVLLLQPGGRPANAPPPQKVMGPGQRMLAEMRRHRALDTIVSADFGRELADRIRERDIPIEWAVAAIADAAADSAGVGLNHEALQKKVRTYVDNAREPRITRPSQAVTNATPAAKRVDGPTEPKRREASEAELREAAIEAHRGGFVPEPLRPYLPVELREAAS